MNLPLYVAKKFYRFKGDGKQVSRPAIRIATLGVTIGLAVMLISVSVVLGFKEEIKGKVVGFGADIEILNARSIGQQESFPVPADTAFVRRLQAIPDVTRVQRSVQKIGILKTDANFQSVLLKGVGSDYDLSFLRSYLEEGEMPAFGTDGARNSIVISRYLANTLCLKTGDRIYAYFFEESIRTRRFTVTGIYNTQLTQFDKSVVVADRETVSRLNNWGDTVSSSLEISIRDFERQESINEEIQYLVNRERNPQGDVLVSFTIKELYPQIFNWLELLDMNIWVILALMLCVAGFTMISGLLILILERTQTIGVLKTLGATNRTVRHIFLNFAALIVLRGLFWGNLLGLGIVLAQQQGHFIKLDPASYYTDSVPVLLNLWIIVGLNIATFLLSVLALIVPSFIISRIQPAKAIRME